MLAAVLSGAALVAWLAVLLSPWQAHRTRERLEPTPESDGSRDLGQVTALVPARNEAAVIERALAGLVRQGRRLRVIVIDDESTDGTAEIARRFADALDRLATPPESRPLVLEVLAGRPLPPGWGGKLWALEQGLARVETPSTLLLDADVELAPGMVEALLGKARETGAGLVSVMARLDTSSAWDKLLVPPFVFFFKLIYPFARVNAPAAQTAAAAGGCVLARTQALRDAGAFAALRGALIDDCTLAARVKARKHGLWLGLSDGARSVRAYGGLAPFWRMVSRTAFTQLGYSAPLLLGVTLAMLVVFAAPLALPLLSPSVGIAAASALAVAAMCAAYLPIVRFYGLNPLACLTLPVAAMLFLAMTWSSALNYRSGIRARWKSRDYAVHEE